MSDLFDDWQRYCQGSLDVDKSYYLGLFKAKLSGVALRYIQPVKPNQNAFTERFNRTFREEVLDQHLFARLENVREAAHWWMIDYNEIRPHVSLSGMSPVEYGTAHVRSSTFEMCA